MTSCRRRNIFLDAAFAVLLLASTRRAFTRAFVLSTLSSQARTATTTMNGWFDNMFPQLNDAEAEQDRKRQYPEQYPACYEMSSTQVSSDDKDAMLLRPLLKQTQLQERPLQLAYDASKHGWSAQAFHDQVDGMGAAIVLATAKNNQIVGGYNPKGWASMGGARPSVAAFLYYKRNDTGEWQKLQKVGGGGLACGRDDPNFGISFGPDSLVIPLQPGRERAASSKLGPYYERGPEERSSLFDESAVQLDSLKVYVGKYDPEEEVPYSGAVIDMTSG